GVILGAQDQAFGTTPSNSVPLVYVDLDGSLYVFATDGIQTLVSSTKVNDGQWHHITLEPGSSNSEHLFELDGSFTVLSKSNSSGSLLTNAQLGNGYTSAPNLSGRFPATPGGWF